MSNSSNEPTLAEHNPLPQGDAEVSPPGAPRVWPSLVSPLLGLSLAVVGQVVIAAILAATLLAAGTPPDQLGAKITESLTSSWCFLALIVCGPGAFGVVAVLAGWWSPEPIGERLGVRPVDARLKTYGLTMLGSIVPLAVAIKAAEFVARYTVSDQSFDQFFEQITPGWGVLFVLAIALVPGFCEEMLFRGYVQQRLVRRWGAGWGIGVASVLFALAHVMPPNIAVALPLGVWLGVIAWRTGSIGPSIACHAFVNGGVNAWRLVIKFGELSEAAQHYANAAFFAVGAVAFVLACRHLATYPRQPDEAAAAEA